MCRNDDGYRFHDRVVDGAFCASDLVFIMFKHILIFLVIHLRRRRAAASASTSGAAGKFSDEFRVVRRHTARLDAALSAAAVPIVASGVSRKTGRFHPASCCWASSCRPLRLRVGQQAEAPGTIHRRYFAQA